MCKRIVLPAVFTLLYLSGGVQAASEGGWDISNVRLNGGGTTVTVAPGGSVRLQYDFQVWNGTDCPSCIRQILAGLVKGAWSQIIGDCAYSGVPFLYPNKTAGSFDYTFNAPAGPGVYQVVAAMDLQYTCAAAKNRFPQQADQGWTRNIATVTVACDGGWDVSNVRLNGAGASVTVAPGGSVRLQYDFQVWNGTDGPTAIRQILAGLVKGAWSQVIGNCAYSAVPALCPSKTAGSFDYTFNAPAGPGVYQVVAAMDLQYTCAAAKNRFPQQSPYQQTIATVTVSGELKASRPDPPDDAADVPLDVVLSWEPGWGTILRHDVYFGESFPPAFRAGQTASSYDPGGLEPDTTYYWQIDEVRQMGEIIVIERGSVWHFMTMAEPITKPERPQVTAGAIRVKINLYDDLRDDPENVGKDPNAVDPNAVIEAVNKNFRDNGFNYQLVVKSKENVDANDGGPNQYGGDNGQDGATAGDGRLQTNPERRYRNRRDPKDPNNGRSLPTPRTESEKDKAFDHGAGEAVGRRSQNVNDPNNWERIKVSIIRSFVDTLQWFDQNGNHLHTDVHRSINPGMTRHRWPVVIAATEGVRELIRIRAQGDPNGYCHRKGDPNDPNIFNERMAETVKHEIGHVLTLTRGHQIGPDPNDPNDRADDNGHAKEVEDRNRHNDRDHNGNFMAPSNWRHNTFITEAQKKEMEKMAKKVSRMVSQNEPGKPAEKVKQQVGTASGKIRKVNDAGLKTLSADEPALPPSILDLRLVYLYSVDAPDASGQDPNNIEAVIMVDQALPGNESVAAEYTLGFDIDNNVSTGITHGGQRGTDRIVTVMVTGRLNDGTIKLGGRVYNANDGTVVVLPEPPTFEIEDEFADSNVPAVPVATSFVFKIPKVMLGLSAAEVPVIATSGAWGWVGSTISDTAEFFFDRQRWLKYPSLELFGDGVPVPGQAYPFAVSGLPPNSPYELRLNDTAIYAGMLDLSGSDVGSFVFPNDVPITKVNFLIAQDRSGEYAFNITSPATADGR